MFYKKGLIVIAALFLMGFIGACSNDEEIEETVIATVNGEDIYESTWQESVNRHLVSYESQGVDLESEQGQMIVNQVEAQALETLIQQRVLFQAAQTQGLEIDDDVVTEEYNKTKSNFANDDDFFDTLEQYHYTEASFKEMLFIELTISNYIEANIEEETASVEEKLEMYEEYKANMESQDKEVESFEDLEDDIEEAIIKQKEQKHIQALLESLIEESEIERYL